ncbi:elongation of very long chain fatty acids protein 2-like [Phlebotomus argentipes]|uniref:elongation of very long chain fatty acids protein 2-like n=1 Tax=Phlebotomus argentipes TaxID=94469 RepID=UPI00289319BD|nr:elongation of very long chain fatty acids protein 2-like [Phlebotomus argentipes]
MDYLVEVYDEYNHADKLSDDRTKGWAFVDSVYTVLATVALYNWAVRRGIEYMKNRPAFNLKGLILLYNLFVALINAYILIETVTCVTTLKYSLFCNESAKNNRDPLEMRLANVSWLFYIAKYIELFDTVFFVLRKKNQNLSFLHIYHHSSIVFFIWIRVKWFPTGNSFLTIIINSGVHVIMYLYYALTLLGPSVTKYLWWKKYLTILQLAQFLFGVYVHFVSLRMNCTFYPKWYVITEIVYVMIFVLLFSQFYFKAYAKQSKQKKAS